MTYFRRSATVLSLGAGVQSSALYLMFLNGHTWPKPDFAVFADTQAEPESVYRWLAKLKDLGHDQIPIHVVSEGDLAAQARSEFNPIPLHSRKNGKQSIGARQCTNQFKIRAVTRGIRRALGYKPRHHMKHKIYLNIGISFDEIERVREPSLRWIENVYPLVNLKMTRQQCLAYLERYGLGDAPRSACWMCPYRSNKDWRALKEKDPADWAKALAFDKACNEKGHYLHYSATPLGEVDLNRDEPGAGLVNECEGMCGN